jgi:hypothetical protein
VQYASETLSAGWLIPALSSQQPVRALVALDGSPLSEAMFEPVAYLVAGLAHATSQQGELRLLRVVDLPFTWISLAGVALVAAWLFVRALISANRLMARPQQRQE